MPGRWSGELLLLEGLGQRCVYAVAALQHDAGECCPVFLAVAGLAEQAEVAVGCYAT